MPIGGLSFFPAGRKVLSPSINAAPGFLLSGVFLLSVTARKTHMDRRREVPEHGLNTLNTSRIAVWVIIGAAFLSNKRLRNELHGTNVPDQRPTLRIGSWARHPIRPEFTKWRESLGG